tara:strand:- start:107743 stop:109005 length:1263 start_codon:yes stop_codon:yes gene_type:complete
LNAALALLLALGLGLLIGLERGWRQRDEHDGGRIAGIRTFALLGLGGGLCGLAATALSIWLAVVGMAGMAVAVMLAHRVRLAEPDDNVSATNAIVGIITALLGLLATTGFAREAMISAGAITLLLSMREQLHGWLRTLSEKDIHAVAQYGAITLVMLPLLPNEAMGPYDALNPRMLWLVVVFVTGLSFAGYWASKRFGQARGTILAAAIGATYSSTAVTLELSRRLRAPDADHAALNAAIAAATAMMPLRVLVLCAVILPSALGYFALGIGAGVIFAALYAVIATVRAGRQEGGGAAMPTRNPFDLWPAIGFAAMVAALIILARWTIEYFGEQGATVIIGLTGLYDVDAALIAAANMPDAAVKPQYMGLILSLPILANSLVKAVLVLIVGGWRAGRVAALPLLGSSALIGGSMLLLAGAT